MATEQSKRQAIHKQKNTRRIHTYSKLSAMRPNTNSYRLFRSCLDVCCTIVFHSIAERFSFFLFFPCCSSGRTVSDTNRSPITTTFFSSKNCLLQCDGDCNWQLTQLWDCCLCVAAPEMIGRYSQVCLVECP